MLLHQADKLQSLITAAKVPDIEPIWTQLFAKALEGKDVKELLLNVGSGGGAAPAAAAAAPAGGEAAAEAPKEEAKEEGKLISHTALVDNWVLRTYGLGYVLMCGLFCREGGVGRGHGLRSLRLSGSSRRHSSISGSKWEESAGWDGKRSAGKDCGYFATHFCRCSLTSIPATSTPNFVKVFPPSCHTAAVSVQASRKVMMSETK